MSGFPSSRQLNLTRIIEYFLASARTTVAWPPDAYSGNISCLRRKANLKLVQENLASGILYYSMVSVILNIETRRAYSFIHLGPSQLPQPIASTLETLSCILDNSNVP